MSESPDDRRAEFEAQLAEIRIKGGTAETEQRWTTIGLIVAATGVVITIVAFIVSGGQSDTRDVLSSVILALVGISLTVAGSAVFLRYSFARFLRFWMLRMIYEQRAED
jgi:hypothetical protein